MHLGGATGKSTFNRKKKQHKKWFRKQEVEISSGHGWLKSVSSHSSSMEKKL